MVRHTHAHNYFENPNLNLLLQICTEDLTLVKWIEVETLHEMSRYASRTVTDFPSTVFARSGIVAPIYFIVQFWAASIWEWLLIESGVY